MIIIKRIICALLVMILLFMIFSGCEKSLVEQTQYPQLIGVLALLLCVIILLFVFFRKNRQEEKLLESLVQKRTFDLDKQNTLMYLVNDAAALLLEAEAGDYLRVTKQGLEMIGRFVDVDRVLVWQNECREDGKVYYKQICAWRHERLAEEDVLIEFSYSDTLPRWKGLLGSGGCVNGPLDTLPEEERIALMPSNIESILVVPIFLQGEFWGFVSFDDCHNRRYFSKAEENILRSWGILVVGANQRSEITLNLQRSLIKLETVIKSYKGIIWSIDNTGVITTFNGQYLKKIGVTPAVLEGKNLEDARQKNRHLDIILNVEKTFSEGPQDWISDTDGKLFHACTTPMFDDEGNLLGIVGSMDDVTDMIQLQRDLETAAEAAQAANRAKSAFLANMSHEIRTPMNAITGMTSIGMSSNDSKQMKHCFAKIDSASKHLLGVISDILDMSKIEANKFELSLAEFDFEKMLQRVVNVINFRVEERKQRLTVQIDKTIPKMLIGDDQRLTQVITNLLYNSVKFTPEGGFIGLNTQFIGEENGLCTIQVSITDSGIGISPEQQATLFRSFQQAEISTARKYGGTGLGLSISKSIIDMMGGKIWLDSELGVGSTISFTIQAQRGAEQKRRLASVDINWDTVRILAVDDDPQVLEYFRDILQGFGTICDTAINSEEALKLVDQRGYYDIYFVDWRMPGIDGLELTKILKKKGAVRENGAVIMISSAEWVMNDEEAKEAGIDRFLAKPLFPSTITDAIGECVGVNYKQLEEAQPKISDIFAGRHILLAEDVEINREIVLALLEPTLLKIDCVENGAEAVSKFRESPEKYDMILMDVQMPEMDGYEATRSIRKLDLAQAKTIPIIAMTANVFKDDIEKSLESGMNGHLGKPLDIDDFFDILRKYLAY